MQKKTISYEKAAYKFMLMKLTPVSFNCLFNKGLLLFDGFGARLCLLLQALAFSLVQLEHFVHRVVSGESQVNVTDGKLEGFNQFSQSVTF